MLTMTHQSYIVAVVMVGPCAHVTSVDVALAVTSMGSVSVSLCTSVTRISHIWKLLIELYYIVWSLSQCCMDFYLMMGKSGLIHQNT